ncbi:chaplin family protein [Kitasatospora sp. NPDC001547]|uniref:chaplin family protein n=1 Tax=Kitasatospora sp. NPDC001547 TaxID=3364015 RepID=UPI0036A43527
MPDHAARAGLPPRRFPLLPACLPPSGRFAGPAHGGPLPAAVRLPGRRPARPTPSCLAVLTVPLAASPACAGGILPIISPSFDTSCANDGAAHAQGSTTAGPGTANGNLAGLPVSNPFNHCGGAEADPSVITSLLGGGAAAPAPEDDE